MTTSRSRSTTIRGLTLGRFYVDQAEEVPHDVYQELKGRLYASELKNNSAVTAGFINGSLLRQLVDDGELVAVGEMEGTKFKSATYSRAAVTAS